MPLSEQFESPYLLQTVFHLFRDAIVIINQHGIIQKTNQAVKHLFGYDESELVGTSINRLMPEPHHSRHDGYIQTYLRTAVAKIVGTHREVEARHRSGVAMTVDLAVDEIRIGGEPFFVGILRDLTSLRLSERLHRLMSESVDGYATLVLSPKGKVQTWNPGVERLLGYTAAEIQELPFEAFFRSEDQAAGTPLALLHQAGLEGHARHEGWGVRKDGGHFYADIVVKGLQHTDASPMGFLVVIHDITDRHQADIALQQAYANLEEFSSVASHDLKAPLRGIADLMDWILHDLGPEAPVEIQNNLNQVQLRVQKMERMIEDLLVYSKAGHLTAERTVENPIDLVRDILETQPPPASSEVRVSGSVAPFLLARTPLQTVLRNLIANAVKHHDRAAGWIEVSVETQGSYCVLSVSDDGPGIPPTAQTRIFRLFQTLASKKESSGMGLAVARRLVEIHGGRIEVESGAGRRGSTFRVWWPRFANWVRASAAEPPRSPA